MTGHAARRLGWAMSHRGQRRAHADAAGRAVRPRLLRGLAATLDVPVPEVLPPLWHWMLFQDWVPGPGLGPDGHPRRGGFLPPVHDLPRRMWAGGRVVFHAPLAAGRRGRAHQHHPAT